MFSVAGNRSSRIARDTEAMKFVKVEIEIIIRFVLERFSAFVDSLVPTVWASLDTWALKLGFHLDAHGQSRWQGAAVGAWPRIINHWSASEIRKQNTHSLAQRSRRAFDLWPVAAYCIVHEGAPMAWTGFSRLLVPKGGQTTGRPDSSRAATEYSCWDMLTCLPLRSKGHRTAKNSKSNTVCLV